MNKLKVFLTEYAVSTMILILFSITVTYCVYKMFTACDNDNKHEAINKYYLSKVCEKQSCDINMTSSCMEYCYDKEQKQ